MSPVQLAYLQQMLSLAPSTSAGSDDLGAVSTSLSAARHKCLTCQGVSKAETSGLCAAHAG